MDVRDARPAELAAAMTAFDAGGLDVDAEAVRAGIRDGRVLAADAGGRVLGALLLEPTDDHETAEIAAVAVLPARRGQGVGRALVEAAASRHDALVAAFDPRVRGFWATLGFEIEPAADDGRLRGRLEGPVTGPGTDARDS